MKRELQVFLEECKRPSTVKNISTILTLDQFKCYVKDWKKLTSTSPSGRHLGHYCSAIMDDDVANLRPTIELAYQPRLLPS